VLREVDGEGQLLGTKLPSVVDAVERSLCGRDLLNHSSVILFHRPSRASEVIAHEFIFSTRDRIWGFPLPACESCGNGLVSAQVHKKTGMATVTCAGCNGRSEGKGVSRPADIIPAMKSHGYSKGRYFWKPLNSPSPWEMHRWALKEGKNGEENCS
jgi:hypothetical protein